MRLIDGHELYRQIPLKVCLPCPFGEEKECKDCVIEKVMNVIDEAPTVASSPWHRGGGTAEGGRMTQQVDHPTYYQGEYECIDLMRAIYGDEAVRWFCILNAFKYRFRAGKKEGSEWADDQKKAAWYETYVMKKLSRNPYTDALNLKKLMEGERDLRRSDPAADDDR